MGKVFFSVPIIYNATYGVVNDMVVMKENSTIDSRGNKLGKGGNRYLFIIYIYLSNWCATHLAIFVWLQQIDDRNNVKLNTKTSLMWWLSC